MGILFTGDISQAVEQRLLRLHPSLQAEVILVPHHGSGSSSAGNFIAAVNPSLALISSGYGNRFKLPAETVVARYQGAGAVVLDSARCGAIRLTYTEAKTVPEINYARRSRAAIWRQGSEDCQTVSDLD